MFLQALVEKDLAEAAAYLVRMAHTCKLEQVETRIAVFTGQAAEHILEVTRSQEIDLIVMSRHGYTGFKRWALGSVAQRVVRHSPALVLLLHEHDQKLAEQPVHTLRATVALDGSPFAEAALLPAAHLVTALSLPESSELHLLQLVKFPPFEEAFDFRPAATVDFRQLALREAENSLQSARTQFLHLSPEMANLRLTFSVEACPAIAERLVEMTEQDKEIAPSSRNDLLVLTTHGRSGLKRWLLGSVTERVLHGSTLPLLIVHPPRRFDLSADEGRGEQSELNVC